MAVPKGVICVEYGESQDLTASKKSTAFVFRIGYATNHLEKYEAVQYPLIEFLKTRFKWNKLNPENPIFSL